MANLIDIDAVEADKKLSVFKRYNAEIGLIVLAMVVSYLFVGQKQLERDMRNYLLQDRASAVEKMNTSTEVQREAIGVMRDVRDHLKESTETMKSIEQNLQERNIRR